MSISEQQLTPSCFLNCVVELTLFFSSAVFPPPHCIWLYPENALTHYLHMVWCHHICSPQLVTLLLFPLIKRTSSPAGAQGTTCCAYRPNIEFGQIITGQIFNSFCTFEGYQKSTVFQYTTLVSAYLTQSWRSLFARPQAFQPRLHLLDLPTSSFQSMDFLPREL